MKHLKTFRKFACAEADFYLLDKDLEEPYPLILKGDANADAYCKVVGLGIIFRPSIFFALLL